MLKPLRDEALEEQSESEMIQAHAQSIARIIKDDPLKYRSYGPYWWAIKAILEDHDIEFGDDDEPVTREHFNYESEVDLLCAAWAYQQYTIDAGGLYNNIHSFTGDDDEPFDYSIEDTDIESMAV